MTLTLIKNSIAQHVLVDVLYEKAEWMRPIGSDGASLLISLWNKNAHGTWASAIAAKNKLLSAETKNFGHNTHKIKKFIALKSKDISLGREPNHNTLFQILRFMKATQHPNFKSQSASQTTDTIRMTCVFQNYLFLLMDSLHAPRYC